MLPQNPDRVVHPPFRVPMWLRDMLKSKTDNAQIAATLLERLVRGQSDLHEAYRIVNHIGRLPGGAAIAKRFVTQENISLVSRSINSRRR